MKRAYRFIEENWESKPASRRCESTGCMAAGEFRAPKTRAHASEYLWFCLEHVREYNEKWNYYAGMDENEVEAHRRSDTTWQRPTWPSGYNKFSRVLDQNVFYHPLTDCFPKENLHEQVNDPMARWFASHTQEAMALRVLELDQPTTFEIIRKTYKASVKMYHPDHNKGCKMAEERLKKINVAYSTLKAAFKER